MTSVKGGKFVSRRKLAFLFLLGFIGLIILGVILKSEIPFYGIFPMFIFYLITTRTNLFGQRVRKTDSGDVVPD